MSTTADSSDVTPDQPARPYDVFVSYSREHAALVQTIVQILKVGRRRVFIDSRSIEPGELWEEKLTEAIRSAHQFVLIWCCHAEKSRWIADELALALKARRPIIPVLLCEHPVPDDAARYQWIPLHEFLNHVCDVRTPTAESQGSTEPIPAGVSGEDNASSDVASLPSEKVSAEDVRDLAASGDVVVFDTTSPRRWSVDPRQPKAGHSWWSLETLLKVIAFIACLALAAIIDAFAEPVAPLKLPVYIGLTGLALGTGTWALQSALSEARGKLERRGQTWWRSLVPARWWKRKPGTTIRAEDIQLKTHVGGFPPPRELMAAVSMIDMRLREHEG